MFECVRLVSDHKDLIHDCSYDYHGKRLATCSSDQTVKIWDLNENGQWTITASWKTHSGSVWKVSWAHPEFGQIIATCSFDRTAIIWEEVANEGHGDERSRLKNPARTHWIQRCKLVDSRYNVTDVKFSPKHIGLYLATCAQDGCLRIYEAPDIMDLSQWPLQIEKDTKMRCGCLAWSVSRFSSQLIAVGCDDPAETPPKLCIYEIVANGAQKIETLESVRDPVYDLKFAPSVGRSFHVLAVASKNIQIFHLTPSRQGLSSDADGLISPSPALQYTKLTVQEVATLDPHNNQVWRVSWNVTGTMLASSGVDGTVKLWKPNYLGSWKNVWEMKSGEEGLEQTTSADRDERYY